MIEKPYAQYFQKSKVFLFPLLGLPKKSIFEPVSTHLSWQGVYRPRDRKLIILYDTNQMSQEWVTFAHKIVKNTFFRTLAYTKDDTQCAVVMDMKGFENTYQSVLQGKYSHISVEHQSLIMTFFDSKSGEWEYMKTFLKPEKYRKLYAKLYGVEEDTFKGELCEMPDTEKECLKLITNLNNVQISS